jgi:plasmid replication initiation protein
MANEKSLLRRDHDMYVIDLLNSPFKSDMATMEAPIFSLSKKDTKVWEWGSVDGKKRVTVVPTQLYGRATIFDKDIILFALGCMVANLNSGKPISKTIRFTGYSYFIATGKCPSGANYIKLDQALSRLATTNLQTNIITGSEEIKSTFHILDSGSIYKVDGVTKGIEIVLSDWIFNSVFSLDVLTIDPGYFNLSGALERRLYEIAKKHCGNQGVWSIGLSNLKLKAGSRTSDREFKRMFNEVRSKNRLPEYGVLLNKGMVYFYQKGLEHQEKVVKKLAKLYG